MGGAAPGPGVKGLWYFLVTICSGGLLAWLPFVHAGHHLGRPEVTRLAWRYAAAALAVGVLAALAPRNARGQTVSVTGEVVSMAVALLALATMALACVQQAALRREVYGGAPREQDTVDPALSAALEARKRRANARQIAERDPLLAGDLKIGRPDLPRTFDDGGLVDLNSAPATVIAEVCQLPEATAADIVAARPPGGFLVVDEVFSLAEIPVTAWEVVRDRAVVIPRLR